MDADASELIFEVAKFKHCSRMDLLYIGKILIWFHLKKSQGCWGHNGRTSIMPFIHASTHPWINISGHPCNNASFLFFLRSCTRPHPIDNMTGKPQGGLGIRVQANLNCVAHGVSQARGHNIRKFFVYANRKCHSDFVCSRQPPLQLRHFA